ncbi:hypothetical protein CVT24_002601 [Panaeolus cyanescens]|uniref:Uncharacterized protein n=1 Tax=Panaeolus cyanescens TaxID=181874 RepID=A0A409YYF8_9AGAR|nr:hypothetical protein CVT24_002601 [Panaeolus cyanescens]
MIKALRLVNEFNYYTKHQTPGAASTAPPTLHHEQAKKKRKRVSRKAGRDSDSDSDYVEQSQGRAQDSEDELPDRIYQSDGEELASDVRKGLVSTNTPGRP